MVLKQLLGQHFWLLFQVLFILHHLQALDSNTEVLCVPGSCILKETPFHSTDANCLGKQVLVVG